MCIRLDTIPECDGQTDRQTDGFPNKISVSACILHSMPSLPTHDNNSRSDFMRADARWIWFECRPSGCCGEVAGLGPNTVHHRLRIRVLRILKFPKIHEFLRILKLSILKFIKFKLSHSSPPSSKKLYVADTALNFWIKNSVMSTIRDPLTRQHLNSSAWSRAAYYKVYAPAASLSSPSPAHC